MLPPIRDDGRPGLDVGRLQENLRAWRRAESREPFVRRCEGPLLALAGAVLCLVAWAFLAPRGPQ